MDPPRSHVTGVELPSAPDEDHVAFSETSELFEGARERGEKKLILQVFAFNF